MTSQLLKEIREIPQAAERTLKTCQKPVQEAAQAILSRQPQRIYLIGNGTSYYSPLSAAYLFNALAQGTGPQVLALPAGEFMLYTHPVAPEDVIIGISASGKFRDVLDGMEPHQSRAMLVGITNLEGTPLSDLADLTLVSTAGPSQSPVMTKTYISTLLVQLMLMLELASVSAPAEAEELRQHLERYPEIVAQVLTSAEKQVEVLAPLLQQYDQGYVFGAGPAHVAALEIALKLKEAASVRAEGWETREASTGTTVLMGEQDWVIALTPAGRGQAATEEVARHCKDYFKTQTLTIGPGQAGPEHLQVESPLPELLCPLTLVPAAVTLVEALAQARSRNADAPDWYTPYLVVARREGEQA